jgi:restriction system protein
MWLFRGGKRGEHEEKFLREGRVYFTWEGLRGSVATCASRDAVAALLCTSYPKLGGRRLTSFVGQGWAFVERMSRGDLLVMPRKKRQAVAVGEIAGEPEYQPGEEATGYTNWRAVRWLLEDLPKRALDAETVRTVSKFPATICEIRSPSGESLTRKAVSAAIAS